MDPEPERASVCVCIHTHTTLHKNTHTHYESFHSVIVRRQNRGSLPTEETGPRRSRASSNGLETTCMCNVISTPPLPRPSSVHLSAPPPSVLSLVLRVVALGLVSIPAVIARQRLPVFVHAPAVAPPPAFGRAALWRHEERKSLLFAFSKRRGGAKVS